MVSSAKLKYIFLIVLFVFILFVIILTNTNRSNLLNSANITPTVSNDWLTSDNNSNELIVAQLVSYNDSNKLLTANVYNLINVDCTKVNDFCFPYTLENKTLREFTIDSSTQFIINSKSITGCEYDEVNYTETTVNIDQFLQVNCNYIGSNQLFSINLLNSSLLSFKEYNIPSP